MPSSREFIDNTKHMLEHINDPPAPKGKCIGDGSLIKKIIAESKTEVKVVGYKRNEFVVIVCKPKKTQWNKTLYRRYVNEMHECLESMARENSADGEGFRIEDACCDMAGDIIDLDEKYRSPPSGYPSGLGDYLHSLGSKHPKETLADAIFDGI